jgi:plasmid stabilization system protein ParE
MAEVIWNKQAETEWRNKLLYGLHEFGQATAANFVQRTNYVISIIRKHPKSGLIEPLLKEKKKTYRYFHLIRPLKLLYYYIESSDTIRIIDVWDSRREPLKLEKRIKTK